MKKTKNNGSNVYWNLTIFEEEEKKEKRLDDIECKKRKNEGYC